MKKVKLSSNNVNNRAFFLVDTADYLKVKGQKWSVTRSGSGNVQITRKATKAERAAGFPSTLHLGRYLLGLKAGDPATVVHTRNTFDNRRANLTAYL